MTCWKMLKLQWPLWDLITSHYYCATVCTGYGCQNTWHTSNCAFKALNKLAPEYIMNCCIPTSNTASRAGLRSSSCHQLYIPQMCSKFGKRCWTHRVECTTLNIRSAASVDSFKQLLKTYHFHRTLTCILHISLFICPCFYLRICYGTI